jgi:hypothetical protein
VCVVRKPGRYDDSCFREPTLSELLEDPLIRSLMESDGVDLRAVRTLFSAVAHQLGERSASECRRAQPRRRQASRACHR